MLAAFALIAQALRLIYIKVFENRTSVLDKYEKTQVDDEIRGVQSLDELLVKYDEARLRYSELDSQREDMPEDVNEFPNT